jgi:DNA-directed RNA polymerase subunit RPC12/RpoP
MKAIICPQCGAALEDISIEKNLARCDYCRAKILIRPFDGSKEEVEVSLVTRAESGKLDNETYTRGNLKFTKQKYEPNSTLRLALLSQRKNERMRSFGLFILVLAIIIFVLSGIYLNSNS